MTRPRPQERRPPCLDQIRRGKREGDRHPGDYAPPYDSFSPPPPVLDGQNRFKEALEELEKQNKYLRGLVVSLSETIIRQVTAKK